MPIIDGLEVVNEFSFQFSLPREKEEVQHSDGYYFWQEEFIDKNKNQKLIGADQNAASLRCLAFNKSHKDNE